MIRNLYEHDGGQENLIIKICIQRVSNQFQNFYLEADAMCKMKKAKAKIVLALL